MPEEKGTKKRVEREPDLNRHYPSMVGLKEKLEEEAREAAALRPGDPAGHYPRMNPETGEELPDPDKLKREQELDRENRLELQNEYGPNAEKLYKELRKRRIEPQSAMEKAITESEFEKGSEQKEDKSMADRLREVQEERERLEEEGEDDDSIQPW